MIKAPPTNISLSEYVKESMSTYFKNINEDEMTPKNIYQIIMSEAELPLIEATIVYTGNNQSESAKILGLNRGTFRKKLKLHGLL